MNNAFLVNKIVGALIKLFNVIKILNYDSQMSHDEIIKCLKNNMDLRTEVKVMFGYLIPEDDIEYFERFLHNANDFAYIGVPEIYHWHDEDSEVCDNYFYGYLAYIAETIGSSIPFIERVSKASGKSSYFLNTFSNSIGMFNHDTNFSDLIMKYVFGVDEKE